MKLTQISPVHLPTRQEQMLLFILVQRQWRRKKFFNTETWYLFLSFSEKEPIMMPLMSSITRIKVKKIILEFPDVWGLSISFYRLSPHEGSFLANLMEQHSSN
jgi:hypothetical protein